MNTSSRFLRRILCEYERGTPLKDFDADGEDLIAALARALLREREKSARLAEDAWRYKEASK
jgi:hypothetical protein